MMSLYKIPNLSPINLWTFGPLSVSSTIMNSRALCLSRITFLLPTTLKSVNLSFTFLCLTLGFMASRISLSFRSSAVSFFACWYRFYVSSLALSGSILAKLSLIKVSSSIYFPVLGSILSTLTVFFFFTSSLSASLINLLFLL